MQNRLGWLRLFWVYWSRIVWFHRINRIIWLKRIYWIIRIQRLIRIQRITRFDLRIEVRLWLWLLRIWIYWNERINFTRSIPFLLTFWCIYRIIVWINVTIVSIIIAYKFFVGIILPKALWFSIRIFYFFPP